MTTESNAQHAERQVKLGLLSAAVAFISWGASPLYWRSVENVVPAELVSHRVIWSVFFMLLILTTQGRWNEFKRTMSNKKNFLLMLLCSVIISGNWLTFIYAISIDRVIETSIGYFISPLLTIFLGYIFLRESLRPLQWFAIGLASIGVGYLILGYGQFPWIALFLAGTFSFYGLARKLLNVGALVGLAAETMLVAIPALLYLVLHGSSTQVFIESNGSLGVILLMLSGIVTIIPSITYIYSTRRIKLTTIGFFQYLSPSVVLIIGVFIFNEPFTEQHSITFGFIWAALFFYITDSIAKVRRAKAALDYS